MTKSKGYEKPHREHTAHVDLLSSSAPQLAILINLGTRLERGQWLAEMVSTLDPAMRDHIQKVVNKRSVCGWR
jgi:hypothetical protein